MTSEVKYLKKHAIVSTKLSLNITNYSLLVGQFGERLLFVWRVFLNIYTTWGCKSLQIFEKLFPQLCRGVLAVKSQHILKNISGTNHKIFNSGAIGKHINLTTVGHRFVYDSFSVS